MIIFGITEILFSQIPDFDQIWWLSIVAAIMSFTYSSIGLSLGIVQTVGRFPITSPATLVASFHCSNGSLLCVSANGGFKGSLTGISIGTVTQTQKIWRNFQAFGDIAFAYSYSIILIEIQVKTKTACSGTCHRLSA